MKKNNYDQAKRKTWMESVKVIVHSIMFLDVFDLVLPNMEQIFKGKCVFSHTCTTLTGLIITFSWLCKALNVLILLYCRKHIPT